MTDPLEEQHPRGLDRYDTDTLWGLLSLHREEAERNPELRDWLQEDSERIRDEIRRREQQ